jgi:hypothetical protein
MNNYNNLGYGYQQQPTSTNNYTSSSSWGNNNDPYNKNNINSQYGYNQPVMVNNSNIMASNIYPTLSEYKPNTTSSNFVNMNNMNNQDQFNNQYNVN